MPLSIYLLWLKTKALSTVISPRASKWQVRAARGRAAALPAFIKMADEAVHVRDRHVAALYDLGVAGGAAKLFLPPHLLDVPGVAEEHVLEDHVVLQIGPLVAAALEAARVIYLRMGSRGALARDKVGEG